MALPVNLKSLSKGMNIKDKLRLLFEDINLQAETAGKQLVLTPQERVSIISDARRSGELDEIRRVHSLYKLLNYLLVDVDICQLSLYLAISQLEKVLMGIILKGATEEIISEIIYDFSINDKIKEKDLRERYKVDTILFKSFDFFNPTLTEDVFGGDSSEKVEPNIEIQKQFILTFSLAKRLKKKLYEISFVDKKSPINLCFERQKDKVKSSEEILNLFSNLDSTLKPLRIYRDFGAVIVGKLKLNQPDFLEMIQNMRKKLELNDQEKEELEVEIDKLLTEDL